jgi:hypothetical protein
MNSTEKETYGSLLCEETMMNGDFKKVHPDLLKAQPEPQKRCCSSKKTLSRILYSMVLIIVCEDAILRLGLISFGLFLAHVPYFLMFAKVFAFNPNKLLPTFDGERIFGEIIQSFWVQTGGLIIKVEQCCFLVLYTFEGVTYQQKYLDNTGGLLATETYIELIVNRANPKETIAALKADSLSRYHQDTGIITGLLEEAFSWLVTINVVMLVALPLFAIPADCNANDLDCTPTVWMDAILHYIAILGFSSLFFSYIIHDHMKKWQTAPDWVAPKWVAPDRVEKPFVPKAEDRAVDHSLFIIPPASNHARLYLATGLVSFMVWMLYASFECGIFAICYFYLVGLTIWLAYGWVAIITDYLYLEPMQSKYQREGLLPKNITVLKSGGHATNLISIIQYEVDITNSNGYSKTLTAHARIKTGDEHKLLILPSEPTTAFVPEDPPPKSWQTIAKLVASPLGVISFYTWKENAGVLEKCMFATTTGTLFVVSFLCYSMLTVSLLHNPSAGKRGNTVVFLKN